MCAIIYHDSTHCHFCQDLDYLRLLLLVLVAFVALETVLLPLTDLPDLLLVDLVVVFLALLLVALAVVLLWLAFLVLLLARLAFVLDLRVPCVAASFSSVCLRWKLRYHKIPAATTNAPVIIVVAI